MKVVIGSDHRGFVMKKEIIAYLERKKISVEDIGPFEYNKKDDYVDYARQVGMRVVKSKGRKRGILLCGSGLGVCIAANKIDGVLATNVWNSHVAKLARQDDYSNVLCLPAEHISEQQAKKIIKIWLETEPDPAPRHKRRIRKIKNLER